MILAHKIELKPTIEQEKYFYKSCAVDRFVYNWALNRYKEQLEVYKKSNLKEDKPNILNFKKEFNAIKHDSFKWVTEVTKCASEQPFNNLRNAFTKFFSKTGKFPKFHNRDRKNSFYLSNDKFVIINGYVKVPKLGLVKLKELLKFKGKIMSGTISLNGSKWFISVSVDISNDIEQINDFYQEKLTNNINLKDEIKVVNFKENKSESVGIDLGIKTAIVTSDGEEIQSPKPLKKYCKKLKRLQKRLSKKVKGSKNRNKAKKILAKLHTRISNIRKDWLHKVTKYLCVNYKTIALEDLHIKGMIKNHKLAKAISDIGLGMFRSFIEYKAKFIMTEIKIINRFAPSSKTCSSCGWINKKLTLKDRIFQCQECKISIDRDYNASLNILKFSTQGY